MMVQVNGEATLVADGLTVEELVAVIGCGRRGVAVAVNEEVVPRSLWADAALSPEDRVEVLRAAQGGC